MEQAFEHSLLQQIRDYARTVAMKDAIIEELSKELAISKKDNAELEEKLEEASVNEADRTDKKKNTKA